MIAAATRALKPGGRLFMVANLRLPYEAALRAGFRHVRELGVGSGFKVIEAIR
jgi:16S rRNA (guanine1207-N2)-methyltransferase